MRDGGGKLAVKKRSAGEPIFTVSAGPDTYILHLRGSGDKSGKVLVDQKQISKSGGNLVRQRGGPELGE